MTPSADRIATLRSRLDNPDVKGLNKTDTRKLLDIAEAAEDLTDSLWTAWFAWDEMRPEEAQQLDGMAASLTEAVERL